MSANNDSIQKAAPAETPVRTIIVAVTLSLIASIAVSAAAVMPEADIQELANKQLAKKTTIILQVSSRSGMRAVLSRQLMRSKHLFQEQDHANRCEPG